MSAAAFARRRPRRESPPPKVFLRKERCETSAATSRHRTAEVAPCDIRLRGFASNPRRSGKGRSFLRPPARFRSRSPWPACNAMVSSDGMSLLALECRHELNGRNARAPYEFGSPSFCATNETTSRRGRPRDAKSVFRFIRSCVHDCAGRWPPIARCSSERGEHLEGDIGIGRRFSERLDACTEAGELSWRRPAIK